MPKYQTTRINGLTIPSIDYGNEHWSGGGGGGGTLPMPIARYEGDGITYGGVKIGTNTTSKYWVCWVGVDDVPHLVSGSYESDLQATWYDLPAFNLMNKPLIYIFDKNDVNTGTVVDSFILVPTEGNGTGFVWGGGVGDITKQIDLMKYFEANQEMIDIQQLQVYDRLYGFLLPLTQDYGNLTFQMGVETMTTPTNAGAPDYLYATTDPSGVITMWVQYDGIQEPVITNGVYEADFSITTSGGNIIELFDLGDGSKALLFNEANLGCVVSSLNIGGFAEVPTVIFELWTMFDAKSYIDSKDFNKYILYKDRTDINALISSEEELGNLYNLYEVNASGHITRKETIVNNKATLTNTINDSYYCISALDMNIGDPFIFNYLTKNVFYDEAGQGQIVGRTETIAPAGVSYNLPLANIIKTSNNSYQIGQYIVCTDSTEAKLIGLYRIDALDSADPATYVSVELVKCATPTIDIVAGNEVLTNETLNGQPIYAQCFTGSLTLVTNGKTSANIIIPDATGIVSYGGNVLMAGSNNNVPIPSIETDNSGQIFRCISLSPMGGSTSGSAYQLTAWSCDASPFILTVKYTKAATVAKAVKKKKE